MKKFYFFLFCLVGITLSAQEYIPLPTEDVLYEGKCFYPGGPINAIEGPEWARLLRISPNPAGDYLDLSWEGAPPPVGAFYQVIGADGKVYLKAPLEGPAQRISLHPLPPAWYALHLISPREAFSTPFIKY